MSDFLNELCNDASDEIDRLNERVVELEKVVGHHRATIEMTKEELLQIWGGHHITDEQISAAVEIANNPYDKFTDQTWDALNKLGIFRCKKCDGKDRGVLAPGGMDGWITCPNCNGRGWITQCDE